MFAQVLKKAVKNHNRKVGLDLEGVQSIFCHLLAFTTSHRVSILPGMYQYVTLVCILFARVHLEVDAGYCHPRAVAWILWKSDWFA